MWLLGGFREREVRAEATNCPPKLREVYHMSSDGGARGLHAYAFLMFEAVYSPYVTCTRPRNGGRLDRESTSGSLPEPKKRPYIGEIVVKFSSAVWRARNSLSSPSPSFSAQPASTRIPCSTSIRRNS
jgi:hypothetical protein